MSEFELFDAARKLTDPVARAAFLDQACQGDAVKRANVEALLQEHERHHSAFDAVPSAAEEQGSQFASTIVPLAAADARLIAGKYKLLQEIGEGGMGTVYMAEQLLPIRRKVAVKLIKQGRDSKSILTRFASEQQAIALMDHPNIARLYDAGVTDRGEPFFVMELIHGQPIAAYCDQNRLTVEERIALFIPVCHAIEHAHQKGIIHRDIKSTNILVAQYDGVPVAKVIDFGLAKAIGQQLTDETAPTLFGTVVGTPGYMSPEQATSNQLDVDARSDIYSLAAVLYELLTGSTPHSLQELKDRAVIEALRIIREEEPARASQRLSSSATLPNLAATRRTDPRRLLRSLRGELDLVVMKALDRERKRRYQHPDDFAEDLQRYLNREPVQAAPPSLSYRLQKYLAKRWKPVLVATALFLTAGAGIGGVLWQQYQGRERDRQLELKDLRARDADRKRELAEAQTATLQAKQDAIQKSAQLAVVQAEADKREAAATQYQGLLGRLAKEEQQRNAGWRERSMELLKQASVSSTPSRDRVELRSLAARVAIAHDVNPTPSWTFKHAELRHIGTPCCFSPSGKMLAVPLSSTLISPNPTVLILDAENGKVLHRLVAKESKLGFGLGSNTFGKDAQRSSAYGACFAPIESTLFVGTRDGALYRWSLNGTPLYKKIEAGTSGVRPQCTPDGRYVVTHSWTGEDRRIRCWDAQTLELVAERTDLPDKTQDLSISQDNTLVAVVPPIGYQLTVPDLQTRKTFDGVGQCTHDFSTNWLLAEGHGHLRFIHEKSNEVPQIFMCSGTNLRQNLRCPCISRDGKRIACLNETLNQIAFWNEHNTYPYSRLSPTDKSQIYHLALSPNGVRTAIVTEDRLALYKSVASDAFLSSRPLGTTFRGVAVSPEGAELSVRLLHSVLRRFDLQSKDLSVIESVPLGNCNLAQPSISYSPDGKWIVTAGNYADPETTCIVIARDTTASTRTLSFRGDSSFEFNKYKPNYLVDYRWTTAGHLVVAAHTRLIAWDLEPETPIELCTLLQPQPVNTSPYVAFWMQGDEGWGLTLDNHFYRLQYDGRMLSFATNSQLTREGNSTVASGHAEAPVLLAGNDRGELRLVDRNDGHVHQLIADQHQGAITAIVWRNGRQAVTAARDGVLCFWTLRNNALVLDYRLELGTDASSLAVSPDGLVLYANTHAEQRLTTLHLNELHALHQNLELVDQEPNRAAQ